MDATISKTPTAPPLLAPELRPRFIRLANLIRRQTSDLPLSVPQGQVLVQLQDGQPRTMGELAHAEGVQLPTMTQIVDRLERQGWVSRRNSSEDRRRVVVTVTDAGRALYREAAARRNAFLTEKLAQLSETDRAALAAALPAMDRLLES
jgi:DNA-binding MarR family transcriptional regulator